MIHLLRKKTFLKIIKKYLKGRASDMESSFLEKYYNYFEKEQSITSSLSDKEKRSLEQELFQGILQKTTRQNKKLKLNNISWYNRAAAAAVLLFIGLSTYYNFISINDTANIVPKTTVLRKTDLSPGYNKAILTLANGSNVVLDSTGNGLVIQQSNTQITKTAKGQVSYTTLQKNAKELVYNSISTPRGGEYQLVLPDGTKVWLNAASSIRFPVAFVGKERKVFLTGEAYFEVTKNKKMPFIVSLTKMDVEVLGTHFNVSSYQDEAIIKTTLLEGAVKINHEKLALYLRPGEQSQLNDRGQLSMKNDVNLDKEVAWTKGKFQFNSNTIQEIMLQLSRWYDVEVIYEGKPSIETFSAIVKRSSNISQVLKLMETSGVKFEIEGKKIYVK